jgi:hypothetical protein
VLHGGSPPLASLIVGGLSLGDALVEKLSVLVSSLLGGLGTTSLERNPVTLVLKTLGGDKTLDLGSLGIRLLALALRLDLATDDELADIIFLAETKEAADLGGTLGTQSLRVNGVGDAGDVVVALLDDAESKDREIHSDDAATDTLPLALSGTAGTVARMALGQEEGDTSRMHNTLLHGEALLVVATGNLEDVALELVADGVAWDFLTHAAVHEDTELALIFDFNQLLRAVGGERDVQLHLDGRGRDESC